MDDDPRMYEVAQLDPAGDERAAAANDRVFGPDQLVVGIGVTNPALAARCVWNLAARPGGADGPPTVIEAALMADLPPVGTMLVTTAPTLDTLGAMAVWSLRADILSGGELRSATGEIGRRIMAIAFDQAAPDWALGDPIEPVSGPQMLRTIKLTPGALSPSASTSSGCGSPPEASPGAPR